MAITYKCPNCIYFGNVANKMSAFKFKKRMINNFGETVKIEDYIFSNYEIIGLKTKYKTEKELEEVLIIGEKILSKKEKENK